MNTRHFSQIILNGQTPVSAAKGNNTGGNQCTQLMLSNPAKQLAINTTTPIDRNVILADGEASPNLNKLILYVLKLLLMKSLSKLC